jgi:hypothetical protein
MLPSKGYKSAGIICRLIFPEKWISWPQKKTGTPHDSWFWYQVYNFACRERHLQFNFELIVVSSIVRAYVSVPQATLKLGNAAFVSSERNPDCERDSKQDLELRSASHSSEKRIPIEIVTGS